MQGTKVSFFQRFFVITLSLVILGVLLAAGFIIFALSLILVPAFMFFNRKLQRQRSSTKEKTDNHAIEGEYERVS